MAKNGDAARKGGKKKKYSRPVLKKHGRLASLAQKVSGTA